MTTTLNVLEFIDQELGFKLFPVQRFVLKLFYGIPLDNTCCDLRIRCNGWQKAASQLTEVEYLEWLYDQGSCNVNVLTQSEGFQELVLCKGRRGGATQMGAMVMGYETYRLIKLENPQAHYGFPRPTTIQLICVSTDKEAAGYIYQQNSEITKYSPMLEAYRANCTQSYTRYQTPADIEGSGRFSDDPTARATIKVTFRSSIAKGLRGAGNSFIFMDEAAHFPDNGQSCAKEVYMALMPSLSAFTSKDPNDARIPVGPVESKIMIASSPLDREGFFFDAFLKGFGSPNNGRLSLQIPTWDMNPTIPMEEFQRYYERNPETFNREFGAKFGKLSIEPPPMLKILGPDGIEVRKNPMGGWIVVTGHIS